MDVDLVKLKLVDVYRRILLADMQGPIAINGGRALTAKTYHYDEDWDEDLLAEHLASQGSYLSFYQHLPETRVIRMAAIDSFDE